MSNCKIIDGRDHPERVAHLVRALLLELDPKEAEATKVLVTPQLAAQLLTGEHIWALLAQDGDEFVGVLTLHQCASIYAGGLFGEISEFYVTPSHRSLKVGEQLLNAARDLARRRQWQRLEVGSPPVAQSARTLAFYQRNHFEVVGARLRHLL
ncbi:MAG: GNAT family N-acetyltransferase [Pseudomonadales bacterium]